MTPLQVLHALFAAAPDVEEIWSRYAGPRSKTRVGQTLYDAHDPLTDVFLLVHGRAVLHSSQGRPLLRLRGPALAGDVEALAEARQHNHAAVCLDACSVLLLPEAAIREFARSPEALPWYRDIAARYQRTLATVIHEEEPLEVRLLRWLGDTYGAAAFAMPTDGEIARHLGVSGDRVGRARRALVEAEALVIRRGQCSLRDDGPAAEAPLIHTIGR